MDFLDTGLLLLTTFWILVGLVIRRRWALIGPIVVAILVAWGVFDESPRTVRDLVEYLGGGEGSDIAYWRVSYLFFAPWFMLMVEVGYRLRRWLYGRPTLIRVLAPLAVLAVPWAVGAVVHLATAAPRIDVDRRLRVAERFDRWPLFYAGDSVEGLELSDVVRDKNFDNPTWHFFYGECEGNCTLPLEIQIYTICDRFPARYSIRPRTFPFRGARAARPSTSGSLDVYTGRLAVVIFAHDHRKQRASAMALRRVGRAAVPRRLRPPPRGAMNGKLRCQRRWDKPAQRQPPPLWHD